MGCFDTINVTCPKCGHKHQFQTKAGPCELKVYRADRVPSAIAYNILDDVQVCDNCKSAFTLKIKRPEPFVEMFVEPVEMDDDDSFGY